jgi:hypothetical protein
VDAPSDKPLIAYASHVAHGTGRTPIGIVLFACSHLLLGAVLLLIAWVMFQQLARMYAVAPARVTPIEWLAAGLVAVAAVPMLVGGVTLLLKGRLAWIIAVVSFFVLAVFESIAIAYSVAMTVRYAMQNNTDIVWAGLFVVFAVLLGLLCAVVVGYLSGAKARATFGLPPGESPRALKWLRRTVLILYALGALIGPMFIEVRVLFPD